MKKQSFYIPFESYKSIGGPATFMKNLKDYLDKQEFDYRLSKDKCKNIFFPISFEEKLLKKLKSRGGKIVQRLDGIYYPTKHGEEYIEHNKDIKNIYQTYSNHVIFQSQYSRKQCFSMFGEKSKESYSIILNGVNSEIFYPDEAEVKEITGKVSFITTGNFRNLDMIEPVVKALDGLKEKFDFELNVVGPITNDSIRSYFDREYIKLCGPKSLYEVAELLRSSHAFIYSHLNPPCPNSVLEAISSGLPIVGFDSGSMSELLYFSSELLAYVSDDIFQKYEDFDSKKLGDKITFLLDNYSKYKKCAIEHAGVYSFESCGNQYIKVFNELLNTEDNRMYSNLNFFKKIFSFLG